jgi:ketosteroid isomerase-like protein
MEAENVAGNLCCPTHVDASKFKTVKFMKFTIFIAMLSMQVAAAQDNATALQDAAAVEEIKHLEEARNQAILRGDAAALERMTADDYTFITLKGERRTKTDIVRRFASGGFKYQSRSISDLKIRVYGDAAIVTGRSVQEGTENGKHYSGNYRFTRVYVKQNGAWKTVALQTTLIQN